MKRSDIYNFKNESIFLPRLEASLEYLFPSKKAKKPSCYLNELDRKSFTQYCKDYYKDTIHPLITNITSFTCGVDSPQSTQSPLCSPFKKGGKKITNQKSPIIEYILYILVN
jgi:hypothetical protein